MATSRHGTILVVDDEEIMREILETLLTREGYDVRVASSGAEGLEMARALPFDAAIVDIMMPGLNGIATLDELKRIDDDLNVIIITAYASVESAISAMKAGAFDYITKPFKNDEVIVVVRNAMERRRLVSENRNLRQNKKSPPLIPNFPVDGLLRQLLRPLGIARRQPLFCRDKYLSVFQPRELQKFRRRRSGILHFRCRLLFFLHVHIVEKGRISRSQSRRILLERRQRIIKIPRQDVPLLHRIVHSLLSQRIRRMFAATGANLNRPHQAFRH